MTTSILVAGDTGDNLKHWSLIAAVAADNNCKAVYQVGDTGYSEHDDDGRTYTNKLSTLAERSGIQIAFIDGNHENHRQLWDTYQSTPRSAEGFWQLRPGLFYIPRGHVWTVEGVRFLGLGGAYSVDKAKRLEVERKTNQPGSMWSPYEELTEADVARARTQGEVNIMITHDKPRSTNPGCDFKSEPACWSNQDKVSEVMRSAAPELLVHGHLHFPYQDYVRVGEAGEWCQVISLESDEIGSRNRPYDPRNSWLILELADGQFMVEDLPPALDAA
jgi:calcineurin-like phosphoesterase family protein